MRGFRFRSSLKRVGLWPMKRLVDRTREKILWYPGYFVLFSGMLRTNIEYLSARENRGWLFSRAFTFFDYCVIPGLLAQSTDSLKRYSIYPYFRCFLVSRIQLLVFLPFFSHFL